MIYLDYSATTPVDKSVLDTFVEVSNKYFANPNSLYKIAIDAKKLIDVSTKQIANLLNISEKEIIYTSGATESNNMAIYGVLNNYKNRGKRIITTKLEHSSISEQLKYLEKEKYDICYVKLDKNGKVDLDDLKKLLNDDTLLVTISSVNSETGIHQDLEAISKIVKEYPKTVFHSDVTQSIGKVKENLNFVDLASFSAQKFYGLKGIGCLIKKENIEITPLIKGGKSTTIYRSGTPSPALIASLSKALRLAIENIDERYNKVLDLNKYLRDELEKNNEININSPISSIPHILNISVNKIKPETLLHALEENDIYISTKTACSNDYDYSEAIYSLTNDITLAKHSLRISLSHLTSMEDLKEFINILNLKIDKLKVLN